MNGKERLLTRAIVRPPSTNFSDGLTTVDLGKPDYKTALTQHATYCEALQSCGLTLVTLPADDQHPDSTFVEDTAILTSRCAIVTRPGAETRRAEAGSIEETLFQFFDDICWIEAPGTLDGGDVCEAGDHFFIGISERTNEVGAQQLADMLWVYDYKSEFVDVRNVKSILHLKSGLAYLGNNQLVVIDELIGREQFRGYDLIKVSAGEEYAANCVQINELLLIASGFPLFEKQIRELGYKTISIDMSEFQKMDGGLSCLSLRY
ncbi:MAG TPA: arginine deiminase family protein [Pyrinomonadaceae bacterium]|jgi:dimethylargininase|nr:arginine deiminase family protein [Pyrinomonadaceae bacterium]